MVKPFSFRQTLKQKKKEQYLIVKLFNLDRYGTQIIYKKNISIAKNLKLIMQIRSSKK